MELVSVTIDDVALDSRSLLATHSTLGLDRGLELLERVVLRDPDTGAHHSGRVVAIQFQLSDTVYTFQVGVGMPADLAEAKVAGGHRESSHY